MRTREACLVQRPSLGESQWILSPLGKMHTFATLTGSFGVSGVVNRSLESECVIAMDVDQQKEGLS
jgi:hypothetical protein